jgi:hypothetical protein
VVPVGEVLLEYGRPERSRNLVSVCRSRHDSPLDNLFNDFRATLEFKENDISYKHSLQKLENNAKQRIPANTNIPLQEDFVLT